MKRKLRILCCLLAAMFLFAGCKNETTVPEYKQFEEDKALIENNVRVLSVFVIGTMDENNNFVEYIDYKNQIKVDVNDIDASLPLYSRNEWNQVSQLLAQFDLHFKNQEVYSKAVKSYLNSREDSGNAKKLDLSNLEINKNKEGGYDITVPIVCDVKDMQLAVSYTEDMKISNVAFNVQYTVGENLKKAGLNTLLGMGTVFVILILISLIISIFGIFPKIEAAKKAKAAAAAKAEAPKAEAVVTPAPVVEELSDDLELVAVISAAIAAYEGSEDTSGYVVRSIRKSTKWQRA